MMLKSMSRHYHRDSDSTRLSGNSDSGLPSGDHPSLVAGADGTVTARQTRRSEGGWVGGSGLVGQLRVRVTYPYLRTTISYAEVAELV